MSEISYELPDSAESPLHLIISESDLRIGKWNVNQVQFDTFVQGYVVCNIGLALFSARRAIAEGDTTAEDHFNRRWVEDFATQSTRNISCTAAGVIDRTQNIAEETVLAGMFPRNARKGKSVGWSDQRRERWCHSGNRTLPQTNTQEIPFQYHTASSTDCRQALHQLFAVALPSDRMLRLFDVSNSIFISTNHRLKSGRSFITMISSLLSVCLANPMKRR